MSGEPALDAVDLAHLRSALAEAAAARAAGDPPFGSVLVDGTGAVIGQARNTTLTDHDITAHPELVLARAAARRLAPVAARAATLYTSCEPCPMCTNAIARAGIGRVVFALSFGQLNELKPAGYVDPDGASAAYLGPNLREEGRAAIGNWYGGGED